MNNEPIFTGPPLKLATRTELVEELCSRRDLAAQVFYQTKRNDDGVADFLMRHSFGDKEALARSLRLLAEAIEENTGDASCGGQARI